MSFFVLYIFGFVNGCSLIKSQVFSPTELSDVGSSPRLPLPVADEGRRGESPRSKEKYTPLRGRVL